jgi:hypothetical protein
VAEMIVRHARTTAIGADDSMSGRSFYSSIVFPCFLCETVLLVLYSSGAKSANGQKSALLGSIMPCCQFDGRICTGFR